MGLSDDELIALVLLALFLLSRRRGSVTATVYGADVAPGVDVTDGDLEDDYFDYVDPEDRSGVYQ